MRNSAHAWHWPIHQTVRALSFVLVASCAGSHNSSLPLPSAQSGALSNAPLVLPTLHGETLSGINHSYAGCTGGGGYSGGTGTASGPYPGTFSASVQWREVAYRIYSVSGSFTITSGQYRITGTMGGNSPTIYFGTCFVSTSDTYNATISQGGITLNRVSGTGYLRFVSRTGGSFFASFQ